MSAPGTTPQQPLRGCGDPIAPHSPDDCADECPRCGEPITFELKLTDDGPTWLGACVDCNAIVEALL